MTTPYRIIRALVISSALLVLPFTASLLVAGWNWSRFDYAFAWVLFSVLTITTSFMLGSTHPSSYRIAIGAAVIGAVSLIWINGAVGIIGESDSNALYLAVIATLVLGSAIARFRAGAMAVVLVLTALVQFLVPVAALILSEQDFAPGVIPVIALNGGWVVLFLFSAIMFSHARNDAEQESAL